MTYNQNTVSILNDLIEINNDRIAGYEKAINEINGTDTDLQTTFNSLADDSRKFVTELRQEVNRIGGEAATGTTNKGKIYRAWMDVKATFTGKDKHSILEACEYGEDAAQKAYKEALEEGKEDLTAQLRTIIAEQQSKLKTGHDLVKKYRNAYQAAEA